MNSWRSWGSNNDFERPPLALWAYSEVMSVLMLYRIASYYVVFAASAAGFFIAQRHLAQTEPPKEG